MLGRKDLEECIDLALNAGLTDPARRSLLLAWLPANVIGNLRSMPSPADQLLSDVQTLNSIPLPDGRPAIVVWLENAERLVSYLPGVPERLRKLQQRASAGASAAPPKDPTRPPASGTGTVPPSDTNGQSARAQSSPPPEQSTPEASGPKLGVIFLATGLRSQRPSQLLLAIRNQVRESKPKRLEMSSVYQALDPIRISEMIEDSGREVLHLAGVGERRNDPGGWLVLQGSDGQAVLLHPENSENLVRLGNEERRENGLPPLRCVVLSVDYSAPLAERMRKEGLVEAAIGHTGKVRDDDVKVFSRSFYRRLDRGVGFERAFRLGIQSVAQRRGVPVSQVADFKIFA